MLDLNLEKQSLPPNSTLPPDIILKLVIIGLLIVGAAITAGLWWRWEIRYARIQEQEKIEEDNQPSDLSTKQEEIPTAPSEEVKPIMPNDTFGEQQPLPQNPKTNIHVEPSDSNILGLTQEELDRLHNFSLEIEICLRNGGGRGCLDSDYKPQQPTLNSSHWSDWKPNYNLPPMPSGVCPPSLVIAYQNQLFCGRRPIAEPAQPLRRLRQ